MPVKLALNRGKYALVDAADLELLAPYRWLVVNGQRYAGHKTTSGVVMMHRLLMPGGDGLLIDHINGNGLDNTRANLRFATPTQNRQNSKLQSNSTTKFKGVSRRTDMLGAPYAARICVHGKRIRLGVFATAEDAHRAYVEAARKYFGEFYCDGEHQEAVLPPL